ncbi:hypothetical protein QUF55_00020 [Clostridiaceae bacterium HSG29]|nr:hypothetical protein [Clostridiaceae bacterium HSG29]
MNKFIKFIKSTIENLGMFFEGALDLKGNLTDKIEIEIDNTKDEFLILCFGDLLGIDIPTSYYALELLPHLEDELSGWQKRMLDSKSIWEQKGGDLDVDP